MWVRQSWQDSSTFSSITDRNKIDTPLFLLFYWSCEAFRVYSIYWNIVLVQTVIFVYIFLSELAWWINHNPGGGLIKMHHGGWPALTLQSGSRWTVERFFRPLQIRNPGNGYHNALQCIAMHCDALQCIMVADLNLQNCTWKYILWKLIPVCLIVRRSIRNWRHKWSLILWQIGTKRCIISWIGCIITRCLRCIIIHQMYHHMLDIFSIVWDIFYVIALGRGNITL